MTIRALAIRTAKVKTAADRQNSVNGLLALKGLWARHKINPIKYQRQARREKAK